MKVFEFHLYSNDELLLKWIEHHFDLDVGQPTYRNLKFSGYILSKTNFGPWTGVTNRDVEIIK